MKKQQNGFSLVAVIFLILIIALAVVFIARVSNVGLATNNLALQSARAYHAALSGSEWAINRVTTGGCPAATSNFSLAEQSLSGFRISVSCSSSSYTEQGNTITLYNLDVLAEYGTLGTTPDYASRRIQLQVEG